MEFAAAKNPILKPLDQIECRTRSSMTTHGARVAKADAIVEIRRFWAERCWRAGLGDSYVDRLFALYDGRVPAEADLVTYWFNKAREQIADG